MNSIDETPPLTATKRVRWLVVGPALALPLVASFFYFVLFPGTAFGNAFYSAIKVFLLTWPVIATWLILRERFIRESPGLFHRRKSFLIGGLFGLAVVGLMLLLREFSPMGAVLEQNGARIRERVEGLGMLNHFVLATFAISIVHAALEEFYWRWFVYGNLRHLVSRPWAYGLAAAGFLSHHIVITSQFFPLGFAIFLGICVGIGGIFWNWLYQRHRTLWGAWFSHMIVDFGIFWIGYQILFGR